MAFSKRMSLLRTTVSNNHLSPQRGQLSEDSFRPSPVYPSDKKHFIRPFNRGLQQNFMMGIKGRLKDYLSIWFEFGIGKNGHDPVKNSGGDRFA